MNAVETLYSMGACKEAIAWAEGSAAKSPQALWDDCHRGEWLLWYAARSGVDLRLLVQAACACARLALPYVTEGDDRPRRAIETAEAWTRGEVTLVAEAANYAADAADAAADAAAYAAAYAAYAATYAAADHADHAVNAAYAAVIATAAPDEASRADAHRRCAGEVRKIIPEVPVREGGDE